MNKYLLFLFILGSAAAVPAGAQSPIASPDSVAKVRAGLERLYQANADAFLRWDTAGVMALRAPDFQTVAADGSVRDRAAMQQYTVGLLNGIKKWNEIKFSIDSLTVLRDTAIVTMSQHLDRMALRPDNQVHHVETWATQRETWIKTSSGWLLWRVDNVHNTRRLVDGKEQ